MMGTPEDGRRLCSPFAGSPRLRRVSCAAGVNSWPFRTVATQRRVSVEMLVTGKTKQNEWEKVGVNEGDLAGLLMYDNLLRRTREWAMIEELGFCKLKREREGQKGWRVWGLAVHIQKRRLVLWARSAGRVKDKLQPWVLRVFDVQYVDSMGQIS